MKYYPVAWCEGTFITPQHFQQQERYFKHLSQLYYSMGNPLKFGLSSIDICQEHLSTGKIRINSASGIFPDFTPFVLDEAITIDIPKEITDILVYVAIPNDVYGSKYISDNPDNKTRYIFYNEDVIDSINPDAPATRIEMTRLNISVKLSTDDLSGLVLLPIAHIDYTDSDGELKLNQYYIPPIINTQASSFLTSKINELHSRFSLKANKLGLAIIENSDYRSTSAVLNDKNKLCILNKWLSIFQLFNSGEEYNSPLSLYKELVRMIGESIFFTTKPYSKDFNYNSNHLSSTFREIINYLLAIASTALIESVNELKIKKSDNKNILIVEIDDNQLQNDEILVLSVSFERNCELVSEHFPKLLTIAPKDQLVDILKNATSGMQIDPMHITPPDLYLPESELFSVNLDSIFLETPPIKSSSLGIYLDDKIIDIDIRAFLIKYSDLSIQAQG